MQQIREHRLMQLRADYGRAGSYQCMRWACDSSAAQQRLARKLAASRPEVGFEEVISEKPLSGQCDKRVFGLSILFSR